MIEHQLLAGKVTTIEVSYLDEIRVSSIQHSSRILTIIDDSFNATQFKSVNPYNFKVTNEFKVEK